MDKQYIKRLFATLIASCNPQPKQFYGSLMLSRGGKIFLKVPKNIGTFIETTNDFQKLVA